MKAICVMGGFGSGKTAVCLGLALSLKDRGYRVAFLKPMWNPGGLARPAVDDDATLMRAVLGMAEPVEGISVLLTSPHYLQKYERPEADRQAVLEAFGRVARKADVVVLEGASPHIMMSLNLDTVSLCRELAAPGLFVARVENDFSLDTTLLFNEHLRAREMVILGTVFNNVPRTLLDKVKGIYAPIMEARGFPVLGVIPKHLEVAVPTVSEYYDVLGGEILVGEEHLDRLVEDVLVGAMTVESALSYLRRGTNKVVITGGDRADIALAALETSTSALILTGGLYPDVRVISRAGDKGVPIILVHYDTYTALSKLQEVSRRIKPADAQGIALARGNFEHHCDLERLLAALQLPPPAR